MILEEETPKIWLLTREKVGVGEIRAMVIRAKTTDEARRMAASKATSAGGGDTWLHINHSSCIEIIARPGGGSAVILAARYADKEPL